MAADSHAAIDPSTWVVRWVHLIPVGARVLDVACGRGRHARFFAQRGCAVIGVDRDPAVLAELRSVPGIAVVETDLEVAPWPFEAESFDAIVVTNYLHRPLFPELARALRAGGILICETFMLGNEAHGRPSNPAFLLRPGELIQAFGEALTAVAFEQGLLDEPKTAVVQRYCGVHGAVAGVSLRSA
jgi:SAM-dependent methyltransferase